MTTSLRTSALVAGLSLALMALIAPFGVIMALDAGETGVVALSVLVIASLDVAAAVALYPLLVPGGMLLALIASAMRVAYAAVFAVAAASLLGSTDTKQFQAVWDAGLLLFGICLVLVGIAVVRASSIPTWIGVLVIVSGLGYMGDTVLVSFNAATTTSLAEFTFVGEVILLIWLIGWGGRSTNRSAEETDPE